MPNLIDLTGQAFGLLTVLRRGDNALNAAKTRRWWCACACGAERLISGGDLRRGHTRSCGCGHPSANPDSPSNTAEYRIWRGIINRCENPKVKGFLEYGGRGIRVAPEWRRDFGAFLAHIGPRPSRAHSVDRIKTNGDYAPGNVRWATPRQQVNNRRCTPLVHYRGADLPLSEAVRAAGSVVHIECARIRIKWGWGVERALETPRLHRSRNAKPWTADDPRNREVRP